MTEYLLTRRAESDIIDMFVQGIEQFGPKQAAIYRDDMERSFQRIAENPGIGRPAASIAEGVRRYEHKSHIILYEMRDSRVLVLAVVHGRSVRRLKI